MGDRTQQQALKALDGMRQIVENEMLTRGQYTTDDVVKPEMKGSICGGRKYCAVGSLWAAHGVKVTPIARAWVTTFSLPGVEPELRENFLKHRHGLRTAYEALNDAASDYIYANNAKIDNAFEAPIEALFEYEPDDYKGDSNAPIVGRDTLLEIIADARQRVLSV